MCKYQRANICERESRWSGGAERTWHSRSGIGLGPTHRRHESCRMRTVRMVAATGIRTRQNRSFVSRPATLGAGPLDYKVANGPVKPRTAFSVPGDRPPRSYGVRGRSIAGQHLSGKGAFRQSGITIASAGFLKRWATRRDLLLRTPGSGLPAGPKYEMDLRSVEGGSADPSPFPRLI